MVAEAEAAEVDRVVVRVRDPGLGLDRGEVAGQVARHR